MNKKDFLDKLEKSLKQNKCNDIESVLEYYEELIEDKKEHGQKEKEIIQTLNIDDIVKNIKIEQKIELAVEKPSLSNGIKALIAVLSILSIPILIPIGAVVFALVVTALALIFSLVVTVGSFIFAGGVLIVAIFWSIFSGELPIATALFALGFVLIFMGLFSTLLKWIIAISKELIAWMATYFKNILNKRKGENNE